MSTTPSADTRAIAKVLQSVLEPRLPVLADLRITHAFLTEDPAAGIPAFHYWAAGVDPSAPDASRALAQVLLTEPPADRADHVYRVCQRLSHYAGTAEVDASWDVRNSVRITYLLWAAVMTLHAPTRVMALCSAAGNLDLPRTVAHPLFSLAMRRLNPTTHTEELQR